MVNVASNEIQNSFVVWQIYCIGPKQGTTNADFIRPNVGLSADNKTAAVIVGDFSIKDLNIR